uniref:Uncharacterized protein n=1 Tax=Eutreptiella gymnastica TaxID=73025 RepID=A0A7S1NQX0_9EUGL
MCDLHRDNDVLSAVPSKLSDPVASSKMSHGERSVAISCTSGHSKRSHHHCHRNAHRQSKSNVGAEAKVVSQSKRPNHYADGEHTIPPQYMLIGSPRADRWQPPPPSPLQAGTTFSGRRIFEEKWLAGPNVDNTITQDMIMSPQSWQILEKCRSRSRSPAKASRLQEQHVLPAGHFGARNKFQRARAERPTAASSIESQYDPNTQMVDSDMGKLGKRTFRPGMEEQLNGMASIIPLSPRTITQADPRPEVEALSPLKSLLKTEGWIGSPRSHTSGRIRPHDLLEARRDVPAESYLKFTAFSGTWPGSPRKQPLSP